jgi:hypothetical protein
MIDCKMGILLLAFAMWFCERVRVATDRSEIEISGVVLNGDKGLKEAVAFPSANNRFCLRHLVANMKSEF